ncbi:MAG TPA: FAD-dependent monooxygenase, partial [Chthoniobacterales bacterium]|nr:FAD-dependent monooxygenase [Chthoniobacterales bacterium]
ALTARFVETGLKVRQAEIFSGGKEIASVDITQADSPYNFALMIPQSETERLLEEHLAHHGVKVEREVKLTGLQQKSDCVSCKLVHPGSKEEIASTRWLIGCDGAHSTVRHQLGMEFQGDSLLSDWILADTHLSGVTGEPAIKIYWHADGGLVLFPMGGSRYRVIADVGESSGSIGEGNRAVPTVEEIQQVLEVRGPGGIQVGDPVWLASFTINERKVSDYRSGRVFLAGDAAHIHSPAGGQGMNTGMQDAFNLAWKLALVSRRTCSAEPLLDSYSTERSAIAKNVLEATGRATTLLVLKGNVKQAIRNHVASLALGLAPVAHSMANTLTEVAVGYAESPLNGEPAQIGRGPKPGQRVPIRRGDSPIGSGSFPRFALFARDTPTVRSLLFKYSRLVEPSPRQPFNEGGLWLARPDAYVALSAGEDSLNLVADYLNRLTQPV